ncbi:MAG: Uma2 family endonuclease [Deltaproteobacteria bacterium]|nr:Uma2 family endonuclease [Deltaproteobacteria bacterium]
MAPLRKMLAPGPFRADQLASGTPYELSRGHSILCAPANSRVASLKLIGGYVIASDPAVAVAGVDLGFSPEPGTLRAPDVAVYGDPSELHKAGWAKTAPPLAVEYADRGGDEAELMERIRDLLQHGTRYVWVVRLQGPRRVEVYEPDRPMRVVTAEEALTAEGVLTNPVTVDALYDPDHAEAAIFRNLLNRRGVESLEALREAGRAEGRQAGQGRGATEANGEAAANAPAAPAGGPPSRGLALTPAQDALIEAADLPTLTEWIRRAALVPSTDALFSPR